MPSNQYTQMINKGQWLEKYLNPEIKTWEYRELAQDAAKIYNIDSWSGQVVPDFALSGMARYIEEQPSESKKFYKFRLDIDKYNMIGAGDDPLKLRDQDRVLKIEEILKGKDKNANRHIAKCAKIHLEVYGFQTLAKQLFKRVVNLGRWEDVLLEDDTHAYFEMLPYYSKLFQEIGIDRNLREVRILNLFESHPIITKRGNSGPLMSLIDFFPWGVLTSRIAFDYLFAGGKDYFAFCQYCGKFSAGKRKSEKKFCSDNCRSLHRHKLIKNP